MISRTNPVQVVTDASSYLNLPTIETTQHILRDHMEMCRFTGLDDVEYSKVAAAILRIARRVPSCRIPEELPYEKPSESPVEHAAKAVLDDTQKKALVDSLRFDQIDSRQMSIKSAHTKTCKWLLKKSEYLDWLIQPSFPNTADFCG